MIAIIDCELPRSCQTIIGQFRPFDLASASTNSAIRFEPDEACSPWSAVTTAIQGVTLVLAPTILVVAITVRSAGQDADFLTWAAFATLIIVGLMMALQASKIGRFGGGHLIICGVTTNYIAVSIIALAEGGPAMVASLIVISAFFYCAVATWLPLLRRVVTPTVAGTVLMLIAAITLPFAVDLIKAVPENAPSYAGATVGAITALLSAALVLRAPSLWRPWSISFGIIAGCIAAALLGIYDPAAFISAPLVGIPDFRFPGFDLIPNVSFWALLPLFLIVTLIQAIKNISDGMIVQRISRRVPRATDFRLIQGSIYANGTGILMSGIAGTPPTSTYPSMTVPLVSVTGVASRTVGYAMAAILLVVAFLPKVNGALLTIPNPVLGGFLIFALGLVFIEGMQTLFRDGLNVQNAMVAGLAFGVGLGMQHHNLLADFLPHPWGTLLGNGITIGTATAVLFTIFLNLTSPRPRRLVTTLDANSLPQIDEFLKSAASDIGWNTASTENLRAAGEESLDLLSGAYADSNATDRPRLIVSARPEPEKVELEIVTVSDETNIEDRIAFLDEEAETIDEADISLRLLRHYASSVKHQKYHGVDVVTLTVIGSA